MFEEAGWSRLELQPERNGSMQYAYVWKSPVVQDSDSGNRRESGDPIDSIYE